MALLSLFFHCSATSFARGSSGLGALNNAWIDSNTVRICRAGDHLSEREKKKDARGDKKKKKITAVRSNLQNEGNFRVMQHLYLRVQQPQHVADGGTEQHPSDES